MVLGNPCQVEECGKTDEQKPQCFRGEPWCSEWHRKLVKGEVTEVKVAEFNENSVVE